LRFVGCSPLERREDEQLVLVVFPSAFATHADVKPQVRRDIVLRPEGKPEKLLRTFPKGCGSKRVRGYVRRFQAAMGIGVANQYTAAHEEAALEECLGGVECIVRKLLVAVANVSNDEGIFFEAGHSLESITERAPASAASVCGLLQRSIRRGPRGSESDDPGRPFPSLPGRIVKTPCTLLDGFFQSRAIFFDHLVRIQEGFAALTWIPGAAPILIELLFGAARSRSQVLKEAKIHARIALVIWREVNAYCDLAGFVALGGPLGCSNR